MLERLGNVVYWFGCLLTAGFIIIGVPESSPKDRLLALVLSFVPILVAWAIRYILSGKKSLKP